MAYVKQILIGALLLFLFHFETLYIWQIKISHLWKGIVLIWLLMSIISSRSKLFIYKPYIWIAILQIVNIEAINHPANAMVTFSSLLILPLIGVYALRFNTKQINNALIFFSSFFILAFVPYQLGYLNSIEEGYYLAPFGGTIGLIGPFQNPHGAAISLAFALVVVLYFWFDGRFSRVYLGFLFLIGFYFLLSTYVRTGLAMLAVGALPLLFYYGRKNVSSFLSLLVFLVVVGFFASNWILSNEVLLNRIKGQTLYNTESTFEERGSGRGALMIASKEMFVEFSPMEKLFGIGETEMLRRMNQKVGLEVGAHNGFLDVLLENGIIGFIVLTFFFINLARLNLRHTHPNEKALIYSVTLAFFVMTFLQGFDWINANLILMLSIALARPENQKAFHEKKYSPCRAL